AVHRNGLADGLRIGSKAILPERIADDRYGIAARMVFVVEKCTSSGGLGSEDAEEIHGDPSALHFGGRCGLWASDLKSGAAPGGESTEAAPMLAKKRELGKRRGYEADRYLI